MSDKAVGLLKKTSFTFMDWKVCHSRPPLSFPLPGLSKNYRVLVVSFFMRCCDNVHHFVVTIEDSVVDASGAPGPLHPGRGRLQH